MISSLLLNESSAARGLLAGQHGGRRGKGGPCTLPAYPPRSTGVRYIFVLTHQ